MIRSTLRVYSFGLIFVSARTNKRYHQQGFQEREREREMILILFVLAETTTSPPLYTQWVVTFPRGLKRAYQSTCDDATIMRERERPSFYRKAEFCEWRRERY
jgi:hypothetical protein